MIKYMGLFITIVCMFFMLTVSVALPAQTRRALVIGLGQQEDKAWGKINGDKDVLYVHPFAFEKDGESQEASQPGYFMLKATVGERPVEKTYRASLAGITALTELKAGQELHLILQVADGAVGGFGSYIKGWNTEGEETVTHSRPGIYSQADAEALLRYLQNGDASNIPPYFYEEEEGVKVIRLYTHADWSSLTGKLEIPSGWLLDGNGYSVGMGTGGSLSGNFIDVYTPDGEKYIVSAEEIGN